VLRHYIVNALRGFWRFKVTALVNLLGLTLAIVCFIATYLFIDTLLRNGDLQWKKAGRTYALTEELWTTPTNKMIPAFPAVDAGVAKYLRADLPGLEAVARGLPLGQLPAAAEDRGTHLFAAAVDPEFLEIFDLRPLEGELHGALGSAHSAIITAHGAQELFGTTRNVVGKTVLLQNQVQVAIAAVIEDLPAGSHMSDSPTSALRFDLLVPMDFIKALSHPEAYGFPLNPDDPQWGNDSYPTYALLPADGSITLRQLQDTLRAFPARHVPKGQIITVYGAVPMTHMKLAAFEALTNNRGIPLTVSPFLLDALILAIACLNYANLTVAIATTRAREIGMRKVLGATQPHLIRQYLVEAALLGCAALLLVLVGTALAVPALDRAFGLQFTLGSLLRPELWGLVFLLLAFISLAGGAYPAFVLARIRPVESLRAATVRAGPRFVPTILVGVQFAAASFLLVVALLMTAENQVLQRVGLRPDRDPVVVIGNNIAQVGVPYESLRNELLRDPNIKSVSASLLAPWQNGGPHQALRRTLDNSSNALVSMMNIIHYDYFRTIGLRVLAGRDFDREHADPSFNWDPSADRTGGAPAVILDRSLTRKLGWSSPQQAIDQSVYLAAPWDNTQPGRPMRVVGVVEDGYPRLVGPNTDVNFFVLNPAASNVPLISIDRNDIPAALRHIDAIWKGLAPKVPVRRDFMDAMFNDAYELFASISTVLTGLSAFAFVIAIMGLIGMAIHITSRRMREIGIRKTLGASARGLLLMLLRDFSKPVLIANLIAWPFAYFAGQLYFNLFTQRASLTPEPFVVSLIITLLIAWLAVGAQALRAATVKPASVLHMD
jgi:putative ABC transport system permease protein